MKKKFIVSGMHCAACSARVERTVSGLRGVNRAEVNLLKNTMTVDFEESVLTEEQICAAVKKLGFNASPFIEKPKADAAENEEKRLWRRFCLSLLFLIPLICLSMGSMLGFPFPDVFHSSHFLAWGQLFFILPILWINRATYQSGIKNLCALSPDMSSLISIGSGAAVIYSMWGLGHIDFHLYFEAAGMILTFMTLGRYLETRAKRKTSNAIGLLLNLAPKRALKLVGEQEQEILAEEIKVGDRLIVKAGMAVAADGIIEEGQGSLDESMLTGESMPVDKTVQDVVHAGTINTAGYFEFTVTKTGQNTLLSQMIRLVEDAASSKAPIGRLADKVSGLFVPVVLTLSACTMTAWLLCGQPFDLALRAAVAVLVISCPCALGLATPTAIMVGVGVGARKGILFKSAAVLENAQKADTVVFDKTGTLTQGKPEVTDVLLENNVNETDLWRHIISVEMLSSHPLSQALVQVRQVTPLAVENFKIEAGGVQGTVEGVVLLAGNLKLMEKNHISISEEFLQKASLFSQQGKTVLYVAQNGRFCALAAMADALRPEALQTVQELQKMNKKIVLLTGDNQKTAQSIAEKLSIQEVLAEVLPQEKQQQIQALQKQGRNVIMVGDGINDAPALAAAHVGVAVGGGTDVALETADLVLMKNDLLALPAALRLSAAVMKNIKQNLFWAFFYNALGIPLAAGVFYPLFGWSLNPMFAALAMSVSSSFVVGNALRLRKFDPFA